jgi:hypothetical protein
VHRRYEAWFPREVAYRAYDAEGRALELVVVEQEIRGSRFLPDHHVERVDVRPRETSPTHADELAELLRERLGAGAPAEATLAELLRLTAAQRHP